MIHILVDNPLLTFCIVAALGYLLGHIKVGGSSLGTAAVLFAGLFVGALDPRLKLPDALYLLGLVLFVYTIGLSSGPAPRRIPAPGLAVRSTHGCYAVGV
jgi:putative transport protein